MTATPPTVPQRVVDAIDRHTQARWDDGRTGFAISTASAECHAALLDAITEAIAAAGSKP